MREGSDDPPPIAASEDWANEGAPSLTASEREAHLQLLSDIARLATKTDVLERLRAAEDGEAVLGAIEHCSRELDEA